ncbi:MAG: hypothetical protein VYE77_09855 [Planctomycetota bacterium]|nr:hypothetical protein [Planctomycetota bacterium]
MSTVPIAITSFACAVNRRVWVGRLLQALAVVLLAWAASLVVLRIFGVYLAPSWWWLLAALPAPVWASWRLRREALTPAGAAVHLDRRLHLDGLLLTLAAGGSGLGERASRRVAAALPRRSAVLPVLRWRRVLPPPLLAGALLALVAMIPGPEPVVQPQSMPAVQLAVEKLEEEFERLAQEELPEEEQEELEQKFAELRQQLDEGEIPEWSELDRLDARLDRQSLLQQLRLEEVARAAAAMQAAGQDAETRAQAVAAASRALLAEGMLEEVRAQLTEGQQEALDALLADDGALAAAMAGLDAEALAELAEAMGDALGEIGEAGEGGRALDAAARQQLADLLASRPQVGHIHGPDCAGGG